MRVAHGEEQILERLRLILNQLGLPCFIRLNCSYTLRFDQLCG